jgi:hypothetical protein
MISHSTGVMRVIYNLEIYMILLRRMGKYIINEPTRRPLSFKSTKAL